MPKGFQHMPACAYIPFYSPSLFSVAIKSPPSASSSQCRKHSSKTTRQMNHAPGSSAGCGPSWPLTNHASPRQKSCLGGTKFMHCTQNQCASAIDPGHRPIWDRRQEPIRPVSRVPCPRSSISPSPGLFSWVQFLGQI